MIEEPDDAKVKSWLSGKGCVPSGSWPGLTRRAWRERLNHGDAQGRTALYWAVAEERVEIVKHLVHAGASLDRGARAQDAPAPACGSPNHNHGWSPVHRAIVGTRGDPTTMLSALLGANDIARRMSYVRAERAIAVGEPDRNGE